MLDGVEFHEGHWLISRGVPRPRRRFSYVVDGFCGGGEGREGRKEHEAEATRRAALHYYFAPNFFNVSSAYIWLTALVPRRVDYATCQRV